MRLVVLYVDDIDGQADRATLAGRADLCALGRTHLYDPQWTLHAAAEQGYEGPGATWPAPFAAGRRRPQAGRTEDPRPRLELIRAGAGQTALPAGGRQRATL